MPIRSQKSHVSKFSAIPSPRNLKETFMVTEHRRARRLIMRVRMHVKALNSDAPTEETVECMNISLRGAYFSTVLPLEEGTDVEVRLKMPEQVVTGQTHEWTFVARVVHREPLGQFTKRTGVGVHFLYYSAG